MSRERDIRRYIEDWVPLLLAIAGFIHEMFLKDKPDPTLVGVCLTAMIGVGVRAGVTARAQAADTTAPSPTSPPASQSSQSSSSS